MYYLLDLLHPFGKAFPVLPCLGTLISMSEYQGMLSLIREEAKNTNTMRMSLSEFVRHWFCTQRTILNQQVTTGNGNPAKFVTEARMLHHELP